MNPEADRMRSIGEPTDDLKVAFEEPSRWLLGTRCSDELNNAAHQPKAGRLSQRRLEVGAEHLSVEPAGELVRLVLQGGGGRIG
jgi:hypothetical protein